ncbi:Gfo/Idh/MocA family oxidoreductase [Micromonospora sp. NPDC047074]|uniref:Gfo/Idh/MocA family protein n=1 Tax=Micromonospora sp. NPDC047074 TaxID=3154339 RepID=UPI0033D5A8DE
MRVGVIGAHPSRGWARAVHLPALAALPDYEVTAVASTSQAVADQAAAVWGARHAFADPYALISHPDVDLVTVAVQLPRRDGLVEAAIAAGRHVYSEWPLARSAEEATHLRRLADQAGVRHAVGLQSRHHPAIRHLRALLAAGRIGKIMSASLTYSLATPEVWSRRYADLFDHTKGVNHLAVVGGHAMDMFGSAVGHPTEIAATLTTRIARITLEETGEQIPVTSPDQIAAVGLLESGATASVHIMTGGPVGDGFRIEVHGRSGRLVLRARDDSLVGPEFTLTVSDGTGRGTELPVPAEHRHTPPAAPPAVHNVRQVYADLAAGHPVEPDFGTAERTHRLIDAIARSAATGTRQRLH